jgi:hypothetical protein
MSTPNLVRNPNFEQGFRAAEKQSLRNANPSLPADLSAVAEGSDGSDDEGSGGYRTPSGQSPTGSPPPGTALERSAISSFASYFMSGNLLKSSPPAAGPATMTPGRKAAEALARQSAARRGLGLPPTDSNRTDATLASIVADPDTDASPTDDLSAAFSSTDELLFGGSFIHSKTGSSNTTATNSRRNSAQDMAAPPDSPPPFGNSVSSLRGVDVRSVDADADGINNDRGDEAPMPLSPRRPSADRRTKL